MSGTSKGVYKLGENWLGRRNGSPTWYRYWYDAERQCTGRASLGTTSFEEAKEKRTSDSSAYEPLRMRRSAMYSWPMSLGAITKKYGMDLPSWDTVPHLARPLAGSIEDVIDLIWRHVLLEQLKAERMDCFNETAIQPIDECLSQSSFHSLVYPDQHDVKSRLDQTVAP